MTPKVRQSIYYLGTIVPALLGLLMIWGGIDAGSADHLSQIASGLVALLGAGAPAVAAEQVRKQRKDGTLGTPAEQVISGMQAVLDARTAAENEVERAKAEVERAMQAVAVVPVLGPLSKLVVDRFLDISK